MPILSAETSRFPDHLFTLPDPPEEKWWLLHTRPRMEKAVARSLLAAEVPFFLPLYSKRQKISGRIHTSYLPLFGGYLFLRGNDQARIVALETNKLANCLPIVDRARIRSELEAIQRVMSSDLPYGPQNVLTPGTPVKILHGPLAGITGRYCREGKKLSIVLEVQMLKRGVLVELEPWMVASGSEPTTAC